MKSNFFSRVGRLVRSEQASLGRGLFIFLPHLTEEPGTQIFVESTRGRGLRLFRLAFPGSSGVSGRVCAQ